MKVKIFIIAAVIAFLSVSCDTYRVISLEQYAGAVSEIEEELSERG